MKYKTESKNWMLSIVLACLVCITWIMWAKNLPKQPFTLGVFDIATSTDMICVFDGNTHMFDFCSGWDSGTPHVDVTIQINGADMESCDTKDLGFRQIVESWESYSE